MVLWSQTLNPKVNSSLALPALLLDLSAVYTRISSASILVHASSPVLPHALHLPFHGLSSRFCITRIHACTQTPPAPPDHDLCGRTALSLKCREGRTPSSRVFFGGRKEDNIREHSFFRFYPLIVLPVVTFRRAEINYNTLGDFIKYQGDM